MGINKTELKVRAASLAVFAVATVGGIVLETGGDQWVSALPIWLQVPGSALLLSAVTWLAGYRTRNRPGYIAPSTIAAAEATVRREANERMRRNY